MRGRPPKEKVKEETKEQKPTENEPKPSSDPSLYEYPQEEMATGNSVLHTHTTFKKEE